MNLDIAAGIGAVFLTLTHFFVNKLELSFIPRSKWLSTAGGISVAYIFIHALPELKEWQELVVESVMFEGIKFLEHHLYLVALLGLAFFYGLERAAVMSRQSEKDLPRDEEYHNTNVFWVHIFSFCLYNFLIGYLLLHRKGSGLQGLVLFVVAMAFHLLVTDYGLLDHYRDSYKNKGRWLISASILGGYLMGVLTEVKEIYVGMFFAFIAGGVILNILKEELPDERKSTFWAFLLGVAAYSALLLAV